MKRVMELTTVNEEQGKGDTHFRCELLKLFHPIMQHAQRADDQRESTDTTAEVCEEGDGLDRLYVVQT